MAERTITCIACPRGCSLQVSGFPQEELTVVGNRCPKGHEYAVQEVFTPLRVLTTTVATTGKRQPRLPVKTSGEIPRKLFFAAMAEVQNLVVEEPKVPGGILVSDFLGQGVDLVSTGEWDGR